ncbi:MAG TPA: glycine oxidase ThiO [Terriglobales bacterium]|nr:glycine oxidase ThiO [Terriglobales bacterium]
MEARIGISVSTGLADTAPGATVIVRGAGVAGLTLAYELAQRGCRVQVLEKRAQIAGNASWQAGGMLAPWCECESADPVILALGCQSIAWWYAALPGQVVGNGTLVLALNRDRQELDRFVRRTTGHISVGGEELAALEPDLAGRFHQGLFFAGEAHLDPRQAMLALAAKLQALEVEITFAADPERAVDDADIIADCTGMGAASPGLRGVRGEMLILRTLDVTLSRPVRLLHPRFPIYVIPRADHHFMIGATMVESDSAASVTARSAVELINAAYALHPAFAEAEIIEAGVGVRPAFADNLPRVSRSGRIVGINGLYRHGFLLAPVMARRAAELILNG